MSKPARTIDEPMSVRPEAITPRCPQCHGRRSHDEEQFAGASRDWKVVCCEDCGLWFTNPRPSGDAWDTLYPADYPAYRVRRKQRRWHSGFRKSLDAWLLRIYRGYRDEPIPSHRNRLLATLLAPVLGPLLNPYIPPPHGDRKLLDVGCGTGEYLATMRSLGWNVMGIDRSRRAASEADRRFRIPVVDASFPSNRLGGRAFDLITCWQVLEHIERPRLALASMRQLLRSGGRLMLTVPNQEGWAARRFGGAWIGLDLPRHLVHFTPASLIAMLKSEGFEIVHWSTLGHSSWIRHSTRRLTAEAPERPRQAIVEIKQIRSQRLLATKWWSRIVSARNVRRDQGESIFVVARSA